MPQEPLARSPVDKRAKRRPLRVPACVQVDRKRTMIDALLKRCRVSHCFPCKELSDLEGFVVSPAQETPIENAVKMLALSESKIKREPA